MTKPCETILRFPELQHPPSLTSLRAFSVVGQCLSFTKAATQLDVTQSAVSRQIRHLEEALEVTLFHRLGNSIILTDEGAVLHQRIFETFGLLNDAVADAVQQVDRRTIHIAAPPTFAARWLTRRLQAFQDRFPAYDLAIHTDPSKGQRLDCTVRFGGAPNPRHTNAQLLVEEHIAVCAPELLEDQQKQLKTSLIHVSRDGERLPLWEDWFAASHADRNIFPMTSLEFSTLEIAIQAAKNGAGLAVVDRNMIEFELAADSLVPVDDVVVNGPLAYWLEISKEQEARSRSVQVFKWLRSA